MDANFVSFCDLFTFLGAKWEVAGTHGLGEHRGRTVRFNVRLLNIKGDISFHLSCSAHFLFSLNPLWLDSHCMSDHAGITVQQKY